MYLEQFLLLLLVIIGVKIGGPTLTKVKTNHYPMISHLVWLTHWGLCWNYKQPVWRFQLIVERIKYLCKDLDFEGVPNNDGHIPALYRLLLRQTHFLPVEELTLRLYRQRVLLTRLASFV